MPSLLHRSLTSIVFAVVASTAIAQESERPKIGLVLSGGGARGAAHVGVIQVLEELHIPVDYVVGTSMGSVVGGLYAAGYSPDEMAEILDKADWESILSDAPPRTDLWYRRRQDKRRFLVDLEFGWRDGGLALPPGLILGRNIESFLERLLLPVATVANFDDLRIPFRCVAADISDGGTVVLHDGSVAKAIRASMSIPGVFSPVSYNGRVLVDGGVVENVPVSVARKLGAEIVIVVDISTPLADPRTLRSLLGVSGQVIGVLMAENRKASMESLTERDIPIVPELGDLGSMEFGRSVEAIKIGHQAAEDIRDRLANLSVDTVTWNRWRAGQRKTKFRSPTVRRLAIETDSILSEDVIRDYSGLKVNLPLDAETLSTTRRQLAGIGLFERIEIDVTEVPDAPGEVDVVLRPVEKDWGPHYLRLGLGASTDMRGGGLYELGLQHTWTPVNSLGGEWRNELQFGTSTLVFTEFYQPLDTGLRWFVAPNVEYSVQEVPLIVDRQRVASVNLEGGSAGLDVGRNLGSWGEIRVGYDWLKGSIRPAIVTPGLLPSRTDVEFGQFSSSLTIDTLDRLSLPRSGVVGAVEWKFSDEDLGGDQRNSILSGLLGTPVSFGQLTVFPSIEGGSTLEGESLVGGTFYLGGFQRLSGFSPREVSGNHYALAVVQSYYQLSVRTTHFDLATYLGGSIEYGGIWQSLDGARPSDMLLGASVFVAMDSFIGPAYLGFGMTEGGDRAAYVFIGPQF